MGTDSRRPRNRQDRRKLARRRVGSLAGMSLVATTGLFGVYLGNPRVPRAYAAVLCNGGVAVATEGELRDAIDDVNGAVCDTIEIAAATIALTQDLPFFTSSVTIRGDGEGNSAIDGTSGGDYDFYGLALAGRIGGATTSPTPRITVSDLTLSNLAAHDNVEFGNGGSETYRGGALWAYYADAVVSDVTFDSNTAPNGGGALAVTHGTLQVTSSTFTDNYARGLGGAISADGDTTVASSTFERNEASYAKGGAIAFPYVAGDGAEVTVTGSTFTANHTYNYGGAIYHGTTGGSLDVVDSTFTRNYLESSSPSDGGGGAIASFAHVSVSGSTFTENESDYYGGAILAYDGLTLTESTFTENVAEYDGGAVYSSGGLSVDYSSFTENRSNEDDGGAIYANGGTVSIQRSTFAYNEATGGDGGAINSPAGMSVVNSTFLYNYARNGGALSFLNGGSLDFSTVVGNDARWNGGGVEAPTGTLTVTNTILFGNAVVNGVGTDLYADDFDSSFTLFTSDTTIAPAGAPGPTDIVGDPLLGGLADNGGPTLTMLPGEDSPVIDAADSAGAPATDQRGYDRSGDGAADIGAVEVGGSVPPPDLTKLPPSWHQASQREAPDEPCPDGTAPSWDTWPNGGTGGWTCEWTTWWDVNKGSRGGWVTTPGFRSTAAAAPASQRGYRFHPQ